jgi:hypothetical protein
VLMSVLVSAMMSKEERRTGPRRFLHATSVPVPAAPRNFGSFDHDIRLTANDITTFTTPTRCVRWLLKPTEIHFDHSKDVK